MKNDLTAQLAEYGEQTRASRSSLTITDVLERADNVRPLPRPAPVHSRARPRIVGIVLAAAAAIVVVLAVPMLFLGDTEEPQGEPDPATPTTSAGPDTTAPDTTVPPTTLPAEPVEVSVEWTEVTEGNPPMFGPVDVTHTDPFIIDDGSTQRAAIVAGTDDDPFFLWTTEDGIEWDDTPISLPSHPGRLQIQPTPTGYWLIGSAPCSGCAAASSEGATALWHSSDLLGGWVPINIDGLAQEAPFPLTWEASIQSVATVGETSLVVAEYDAVFDWDGILGIEPGTYAEYDYDEEPAGIIRVNGVRYSASGEPTNVPLARFTPKPSAEGLTLIDADTGETAYFFADLAGIDWGNVLNAHDFYSLLTLTPDGLEETGPWPGGLGSLSSPQGISILQLNDAVIVEAIVGEDPESYLTRDGAAFVPAPLPVSLRGITYDAGSGHLYSYLVDETWGFNDHWISADGLTWTTLESPIDLEEPFVQQTVLHRLNGGWLIMKRDRGPIVQALISADGEEWHSIDPPPNNDGSLMAVAWEDRVLVFGEPSNSVGILNLPGG